MAILPLYILHPIHVVPTWIDELNAALRDDPQWTAWELCPIALRKDNDFRVDEVLTQIVKRPGPVVIFDCAKAKPREMLRERLMIRSVVVVVALTDSTDLLQQVIEAQKQHLNGEPLLPKKYVSAVQIVRKLYRREYWGGTRGKNYLAVDKLVSGGIDPRVLGVARQAVNDLRIHSILLPKYGKQTPRQKYALNDRRVREIETIIEDGVFPQALMRLLFRDKSTVPRNALEWQDQATSVHRRTEKYCPGCGYVLSASPVKCPDCGYSLKS